MSCLSRCGIVTDQSSSGIVMSCHVMSCHVMSCHVLAGVGIVADQSSSGIVENSDSPRSVVHRNWAVHRHHLNLISLAFSFDKGLDFLRILSHHSSPCARLPLGCASIDHNSHGKDCQAQNGFAVHPM